MEMYGKIRCVTYEELVAQESPILTKANYGNYVKRGKFRVVQRGGNGRKVLIDYNSLPDTIRQAYNERYPDAESEIKERLMGTLLVHDGKAVEFYRKYRLADGSGLTDKKQAECVLNAQVLNEMMRIESETRALHSKCGFIRKPVVWEVVQGTCVKLRISYQHTLPNNAVRLREKYNLYKREGYTTLVGRKVGNQNTRKIGASEARLLLKLKRSRVPVYTDRQIFDEFNRIALKLGFKVLKSSSSVRNFLYDPSVTPLWWDVVYGELEWKKKFSTLLKTERPGVRDAVWYSDGTKLNLYYKDTQGKMRTTSVYEVMDAYSEVLLGYDIAPGECFDSQYRAFRMAVETSKMKPYEIVNDNQGGHKKLAAQGLFARIAQFQRPTMPYNGQSKTIESVFGRFQQQILHKLWYFTGQNITTVKKSSRPNLEFVEANVHALPTFEELKQIYAGCRREWNEAVHPATGISRKDMYAMSHNPLSVQVTELDIIQMFWLKSNVPVSYTNDGLKITIGKQEYHYEVYGDDDLRDERFALRNIGRKFYIMYDPQDMTLVELWHETASGLKWAARATPKVCIHRACQEQTPEERRFMRAQLEANKTTRAAMKFQMEDFDLDEQIAAELFGLTSARPKGISQKKMDAYRTEYEHGRMQVPVVLPGESKSGNLSEAPEQSYYFPPEDKGENVDFSTVGEYEKAMSNATFDLVQMYRKG